MLSNGDAGVQKQSGPIGQARNENRICIVRFLYGGMVLPRYLLPATPQIVPVSFRLGKSLSAIKFWLICEWCLAASGLHRGITLPNT